MPYTDHAQAAKALFESKSLDALSFLLEQGRELEFSFRDKAYFLSLFHAERYISLWCGDAEQSFVSLDALYAQAVLDGIPFHTAWEEVRLDYLF